MAPGTSLYNRLTTDGGTAPALGHLAAVLVGILASSIFGGVSAVVRGFFQFWLIRPINGFAHWLSTLVSGIFGWIGFGLFVGGQEAVAFTAVWGFLAFVVGVGFVLGLAYIVAWGRDRF